MKRSSLSLGEKEDAAELAEQQRAAAKMQLAGSVMAFVGIIVALRIGRRDQKYYTYMYGNCVGPHIWRMISN